VPGLIPKNGVVEDVAVFTHTNSGAIKTKIFTNSSQSAV